jgi:hypothetical protein
MLQNRRPQPRPPAPPRLQTLLSPSRRRRTQRRKRVTRLPPNRLRRPAKPPCRAAASTQRGLPRLLSQRVLVQRAPHRRRRTHRSPHPTPWPHPKDRPATTRPRPRLEWPSRPLMSTSLRRVRRHRQQLLRRPLIQLWRSRRWPRHRQHQRQRRSSLRRIRLPRPSRQSLLLPQQQACPRPPLRRHPLRPRLPLRRLRGPRPPQLQTQLQAAPLPPKPPRLLRRRMDRRRPRTARQRLLPHRRMQLRRRPQSRLRRMHGPSIHRCQRGR